MEYENSQLVTTQLTNSIYNQDARFDINDEEQANAFTLLRERKREHFSSLNDRIKGEISDSLSKLLQLSSEKGASIWLTSLPLREHGFRLNKQQFEDALCLRYGLQLKNVPRSCFCGSDYSIEHCLSCKHGGYIHMRHDSVRDTFHEILQDVCKDVRLEPSLLPVTGEVLPAGSNDKDGARSDVCALGFWTPLNRAFFDIKVINPLAQSNRNKEVSRMYKDHEEMKKKSYNARILQIEKGTFTPVVFSCTGGAAIEATNLIKRLALKRSIKRQETYSANVSFLRRRIRFDILRTCLISLRGDRSPRSMNAPEAVKDLELDLQEMDMF